MLVENGTNQVKTMKTTHIINTKNVMINKQTTSVTHKLNKLIVNEL